ncbi:hypothetical protein DFP72DRAFT_1108302 [Ephemerocybe angulata]|uniref:MYND-type domain-containing protein n=1 Tax=Ephemerocybe angulata TaxID=980116 RepID=A0A8H6MGY8_9AGAR|nr:hypothetical protein DFP72DRAFT_1108302 [Tulosesus angulatus]
MPPRTRKSRRTQDEKIKLLDAVCRARCDQTSSKALVDYLAAEQDFEVVEEFIQIFDPSLIPTGPLPLHDQEGAQSPVVKRAEAVVDTLHKAGIFFKALVAAPVSETSTEYRNECLERFAPHWYGVTRWISYSFLHASKLSDHIGLVHACTSLLIGLTASAGGVRTALNEEFGIMSCTIDTLFILLAQVNKPTGKYINIPPSLADCCALVELLTVQFNSEGGREAIHTRLLAVSKTVRRAVLASLVERPEQLVDSAQGMGLIGAAKSLTYHMRSIVKIGTDIDLWDEIVGQGVIEKCASALSKLVEMAHEKQLTDDSFWRAITEAVYHFIAGVLGFADDPAASLASMIKDGFFLCIIRCMHHSEKTQTHGFWLPPRRVIPYIRVRKVFEALQESGHFELFRQRGDDLPEWVEENCRGYETAYQDSYGVYVNWRNVPVIMCSNLNHVTSRVNDEASCGKPKTCGGCRSVIYCSKECQEEDWNELHLKECRALRRRLPRHESIRVTSRSFQEKRDQLAYIQYFMSMKPRDYVVPVARKRPGKPWDEGSPCWYLDLASPPRSSQEPAKKELDMVDFTNADTEWQPRILHCIDGTQGEPEKSVIVEAVFPLDSFARYNIFAKMKIYTQDGKTGMVQVVSSVFRAQ